MTKMKAIFSCYMPPAFVKVTFNDYFSISLYWQSHFIIKRNSCAPPFPLRYFAIIHIKYHIEMYPLAPDAFFGIMPIFLHWILVESQLNMNVDFTFGTQNYVLYCLSEIDKVPYLMRLIRRVAFWTKRWTVQKRNIAHNNDMLNVKVAIIDTSINHSQWTYGRASGRPNTIKWQSHS